VATTQQSQRAKTPESNTKQQRLESATEHMRDYARYNVLALAYQGKDIVFRFILEYSSSFRDFYRPLGT
jgi:hypothetical protein